MAEAGWEAWTGRTQTLHDIVTFAPARALAATLDHPSDGFDQGAELPGPWVWLYFLPLAPMSEVGPDGHPKRGGFLPPVELPRRMWAGSRCAFHAPVRIGDRIARTSTIAKVAEKAGKAGSMVFVTVRHETTRDGVLLIEEEQDIVYVAIPDRFVPPEPTPLPACDWSAPVAVDPVLLFRFSALTFNGHRIHYDRPYAMEVERYPGLVVHGPLQAVLLFDAACRREPGRTPARFSFRGLRPVFDHDALTVNGRAAGPDRTELYTCGDGAAIGMQASIDWRAA